MDFQRWAARHNAVYQLGSTGADVRQAYENLRAELAEHPVVVPKLGKVDETTLDHLVIGSMFSKKSFPQLASTISQLKQLVDSSGDRPTAKSADASAAEKPKGVLGPAFYAIRCNDTDWNGNRTSLKITSAVFNKLFPLLGGSTIREPCVFWDRPDVTMPTPNGEGVPPVLMVQSEHDPSTPIEGARRAHKRFEGSRMLTVVDEGDHGIYATGNACVDNAVESYLVDGELPDNDFTCQGTPPPVPSKSGQPGSN